MIKRAIAGLLLAGAIGAGVYDRRADTADGQAAAAGALTTSLLITLVLLPTVDPILGAGVSGLWKRPQGTKPVV